MYAGVMHVFTCIKVYMHVGDILQIRTVYKFVLRIIILMNS